MAHGDTRFRLRLTWLVALLAAIQLLGTLLFSSGFLLSRTSVKQVSSRTGGVDPSRNSSTAIDETAHSSAPFSKVVMLILDAARLDFWVPQSYTGAGTPHAGAMARSLARIDQLVRHVASRCPGVLYVAGTVSAHWAFRITSMPCKASPARFCRLAAQHGACTAT